MSLTAFHGRCPTCGQDHSNPIDLSRIYEKMIASRAVEQEVTKPQEPSVNKDREGAYNVIDRHLRNTLDDYEYADYSTELELIFTTPQPCQRCAEKQSAIDVWEGRYADLATKCSSMGNDLKAIDSALDDSRVNLTITTEQAVTELKAKCAELESDVESLTEENDSRLETSIKQHARIMALEAEVEQLTEKVVSEDACYWKDRYDNIFTRSKELEAESAYHFQLYQDLGEVSCLESDYQEREYQEAKRSAIVTARKLAEQKQAERISELEVERDDWKSRYESNLSVNQMHSDNNAGMLKFNAKLLSDIDALKEQNNAYAMLTKSQDSRLSEYYAKSQQYKDAVATLDSEKEANAILTQERDALAMQVAQMRDALEPFTSPDVVDETGGTMPLMEAAEAALALPDLSAEVIKRHDAAVLRKAADTTLSEQNVLLDGMHGYTALKIQGLMIESLHLKADELEKSCPPSN